MAKKSAKQENVQSLMMVLNGGLNYSQSRANISDNELTRARNFIYDPATDYLMTRPGTVCQTAAVVPGDKPILKGYYYETIETGARVGYHICASNGKLWYLSGGSLDTWTEIGNLTDSTTTPSFLTFNKTLLIADGGTHIRTWDGAVSATYGVVADSPAANALSMIKNRVVANAVDELDGVYLSCPFDAEVEGVAWNTASAAVGFKAGFGDMLTVNAFATFGNDLIISKVGTKDKRIYRLNVADATPTNWFVQDLSQNNAAQNAHTMLGAWNNVYLVDSNGFKSIRGITDYGDLQVDAIGRKINTVFSQSYTCNGIAYLPSYNTIWFNIGDRVYCYTERHDPQSDTKIPAFTDITFQWGRCTSMYEAGDTVYLTGYNGYLYKLDETVATDEITPGVTVSYISAVRTKTLTFFVDGILRKLQFYLKPKAEGVGNINICTEENTQTIVSTFATLPEGTYLYDATGYLNDATEFLYDTGTSPWIETSRNRLRNDEMAFELELTSGRCGIEWCKAEIALVEGGE